MKLKIKLPIKKRKRKKIFVGIGLLLLTAILLTSSTFAYNYITSLKSKVNQLNTEKDSNLDQIKKIGKELEELKNRDEYKINLELKEEVDNIHKTYTKAVAVYEELLILKEKTGKTADYDDRFTKILVNLSSRDYNQAEEKINSLSADIKKQETQLAASYSIPQNVPENNAPPGSGYSRQRVTTEAGPFLVSLVAADLGSTKVIVDTASDGDCTNDCPVLPLAEYASRNGAYAGVNGSYFCPATYPSCAGKTNTFDLLVMNHKKTYFNSGNNVYTNNPAVIFGDSYTRFVFTATEWGRDTSPNGVLSNYPLLLFNSEVKFGGDDDPKKGSRGNRSFVASKGNTVYIGVVHSATVAESARVMKALGFENALNLDNGGSTALWSGGYKVGPGRNLPNVILFVRK